MDEDLILYCLSIFLLILIVYTFKFNKLSSIIQLAIYVLYSGKLYYHFLCDPAEGSSLVYWFYLLLLTGVHLSIAAGYLIYKSIYATHRNREL